MERLRYLRKSDIPGILNIYAPFILNTAITFEENVPTESEFSLRIESIASKYPFFVAEVGGTIVGYAYATVHRERAAYRWIVETSVYLLPGSTGKGLGKRLYEKLLAELSERGFTMAYGIITLPNSASIGLHRTCGFEEMVVHDHAGWKQGAWHQVLWMRKILNPFTTPPTEPVFKNCLDSE